MEYKFEGKPSCISVLCFSRYIPITIPLLLWGAGPLRKWLLPCYTPSYIYITIYHIPYIYIYIPYGISPLLYGILRKSILGLFFDGSKYHRMHIDELSHLRAVLSMISSGVSPWTWNPVLNEPGVKWNRVLNTAEVAWKANTHLRSSLLPNNLNYFPDLSWSSQ